MPSVKDVEQLISDMGGKVEETAVLPDGSGFATATMPLPEDHWLTKETKDFEAPPMPMRMGTDNQHHDIVVKAIWKAAQYAIRSATNNGKIDDFDPDALCQNMVVGLIGYHTVDGLSNDDWADPKPVPPLFSPPDTWGWFWRGADNKN